MSRPKSKQGIRSEAQQALASTSQCLSPDEENLLVQSALGLNEHHQSTVLNYMRFARYQRGQRLRAVDSCFEDLKDSRLTDDTFTIDEVTEMLDGLLAVVRGEVESELINTAHTNVLLLRQLFQQSEKWHLKLQADISELENRDLLEAIKNFEEAEFAGAKYDDKALSRLEPLNEGGGAALLQMEIQRLNDENEKLKDRLSKIEGQALNASRDKSALQAELERTQGELGAAKHRKPGRNNDSDVDELRGQMSDLKGALSRGELDARKKSSAMEGDLVNTKHELLRIQEMLEMAEKELEKKVSQTAPFRNLKQMLQKKNEQIKDLRKRLGRYEDLDD